MLIAALIVVTIVSLAAITSSVIVLKMYRKDVFLLAEKLSAKTWNESVSVNYRETPATVKMLSDEDEYEIEDKNRG